MLIKCRYPPTGRKKELMHFVVDTIKDNKVCKIPVAFFFASVDVSLCFTRHGSQKLQCLKSFYVGKQQRKHTKDDAQNSVFVWS